MPAPAAATVVTAPPPGAEARAPVATAPKPVAAAPPPITGKAEILNLAPPIGTSVNASDGSVLTTGLFGNTPHNPYLSSCHDGILLPLACNTIGAAPFTKGSLSAGDRPSQAQTTTPHHRKTIPTHNSTGSRRDLIARPLRRISAVLPTEFTNGRLLRLPSFHIFHQSAAKN